MKDLNTQLSEYSNLGSKERLDSYKTLIEIAKNYLLTNSEPDEDLANKICYTIWAHRQLMGASKKYESAIDIEIELAILNLAIARIAYPKLSKELIKFIKDVAYYSKDEKEKQELERELEEINR